MDTSSTMLERLTSADKKKLFAAIAKDFIAENGSESFSVEDDEAMIGCFIPYGAKAAIIHAEETSPYLDEIRKRAATADLSISLEEFIQKFEADPED